MYSACKPEIKFIEGDMVENKTPILQYTDDAYYKTQMKKGKLPDIDLNSSVITYKDMKLPENWKTIPGVHFFNSSGTNQIKNTNLSIVGTPIVPTFVALLIHKSLNLGEITTMAKAYRKIDLDGVTYNIFTYKDENLAQLEQRWARMELEQAAARARSMWNLSKVTVYSTIPLRIVDEFVSLRAKNSKKRVKNESISIP